MKIFYTRMTAFLAVIFLFGFSTLRAQIVTGAIGDGTFNGSQAYGIDFNRDGNLEFSITSMNLVYSSYNNCVLTFMWSEGGNNIVTAGTIETQGWDEIVPLAQGTSVGAGSNFGAQGDAYLFSTSEEEILMPVGVESYIGFRIKIDGTIHYGWAKVLVTSMADNGFTAQWLDCAYETTPNRPIAAGITNNSGIAEGNPASVVALFPNPTSDVVYIDSQLSKNEEVAVFDINGRKVHANISAQNGRVSVDLKHCFSGVYFIQVNRQFHKVVKK